MHSVTHVPPPNTVHRIVFSNSIKISSSVNLFRLTDRSVRFTQSIKPKNSTGSKRSLREARIPLQVSWLVPSTAGLPKVYGETMAMFRWSSMKSKKYCTNLWHFRWTSIKKNGETRGTWNSLAPYGATGRPLRVVWEASDWRKLYGIALG